MTRLLEAVKTYDKKAHSWHQLKRLAGVKKIFQLIGRLADGNWQLPKPVTNAESAGLLKRCLAVAVSFSWQLSFQLDIS
jgi:hypothetical protein